MEAVLKKATPVAKTVICFQCRHRSPTVGYFHHEGHSVLVLYQDVPSESIELAKNSLKLACYSDSILSFD